MAIGQVQTGTRPGGGVSTGTPYRTTPLTPNPVTPLNSGHTRAAAGTNATLGSVRPDRAVAGTPMQPQQRSRVLRPLVADRAMQANARAAWPGAGMNPNTASLMPSTASAYAPGQPQIRGPYSPTPGSAGPNFNRTPSPMPQSPSPFAGLTATRGQNGNAMWRDASGQQRFYVNGQNGAIWDYQNNRFARPAGNYPPYQVPPGQGKPIPRPLPNPIPRQPPGPRQPLPAPGQTPPIWGGYPPVGNPAGGWDGGRMPTNPGGYDGSGINPGGMYGIGSGQNGVYW